MANRRTENFFYCLAIALSVMYLVWRICFTIPWDTNLLTLIYALLLWGSEVVSGLTAYITIVFRMITSPHDENFWQPPILISEQPVPDVDILIATHNEELSILEKTIIGATHLTYPNHKKHIYVCDDGNRPAVAQLAERYEVGYIGMADNHEAKSGNLNHALSLMHSPLFVDFDADMVPYNNFLLTTVPYFQKNWLALTNNPDHTKPLGFVQTPQSFYENDIFQFNLFSEQIVANEQDFFSRDVNVLYGRHGYTIFTGSNALFLRQAVDEVGGFPTKTLTEDFELGARINLAGYTSLSTPEACSSGTTPLDLKGVIKQRSRWARGVIQSCRNLHIFLNPKFTWTQRIILINAYFYWWSFFRRLIYIVAPILYAIWKIQVVDTNFWLLMIMWAPGYALLHFILGDSSSVIRSERWGEIQETFFAPYLCLPVLLQWFHIKAHKFKVTSKTYQRSLQDRLYVLPHLILWLLTTYAIFIFNYGKWGSEILIGSVITFWLLMHWINLTFAVLIGLGRQVFRQQTRFPRQVKGKLNADTPLWFKTIDVSDQGMSLELATPHILQPGLVLTGQLYLAQRVIPFKLTIVRPIEPAKRYAGLIKVAAPAWPDYLYLVYNGSNQALPTAYDFWITPFDVLHLNLQKRLENLQYRLRRRFTREE